MNKNKKETERISLMIRPDQRQLVTDKGLNLSGLVRDLIDDHFASNKVTITLNEGALKLYRQVVSNTGATDEDIEPYLKKALSEMLNDRIELMQRLAEQLKKKEI